MMTEPFKDHIFYLSYIIFIYYVQYLKYEYIPFYFLKLKCKYYIWISCIYYLNLTSDKFQTGGPACCCLKKQTWTWRDLLHTELKDINEIWDLLDNSVLRRMPANMQDILSLITRKPNVLLKLKLAIHAKQHGWTNQPLFLTEDKSSIFGYCIIIGCSCFLRGHVIRKRGTHGASFPVSVECTRIVRWLHNLSRSG